ncbi:MAG: LPS export ABC transporter permease LptF [Proteobacteria bacterium]|nr:LPS export ABC transporter permease LptF [Pseudomonadota bacterium]
MNFLTRYILKQILIATVFVAIILCFAIWLTQSLRLVDLIINRGLPLSMFIYMALLLLPRFLTIVLPIAVFCATLFTYNRLTTDSEIVVMRSAGISQLTIARPGLFAGALAACVMAFINLYLLPVSYREFKELQFAIRNDYSSILLQEGVFNSLGEGITVFIRERAADGELRGILVHDSRDSRAGQVTMMAERGAIVQSEEGPRVILISGNRQQVDRAKGEMSLLYFDRYVVEIGNSQESNDIRYRDPRERFLPTLLFPGNSEDERRNRDELIAEGHNRLTTILLPITYSAIGITMLLIMPFSRRGQTSTILIAIALVTAIAIGQLSLNNLAVRFAAAIPGMYLVTIVPLLLSLYLMSGQSRRRFIPASLPTQ